MSSEEYCAPAAPGLAGAPLARPPTEGRGRAGEAPSAESALGSEATPRASRPLDGMALGSEATPEASREGHRISLLPYSAWPDVLPVAGVGLIPTTAFSRNRSLPNPKALLCPDSGAEDLYAAIEIPGGDRGDSGVDLRFAADVTIAHGAALDGYPVVVGLGVRARCLVDGVPSPYLLFPRSSLGKTPLSLANAIGLIDAGYTGELRVALRNHSAREYTIKRGTSLFQLVCPGLQPATVRVVGAEHPLFAEGASLRGGGGFGSTGAGGASARAAKEGQEAEAEACGSP